MRRLLTAWRRSGSSQLNSVSKDHSKAGCRNPATETIFDPPDGIELRYARVSTIGQDLDRKIDALTASGIDPDCIYVDRKSGATTDHPGLTVLLEDAVGGIAPTAGKGRMNPSCRAWTIHTSLCLEAGARPIVRRTPR
ncbi:recombinase family protein [Rhodococcus sp. NPDC059234]|uniref:recombinase family protein n=1 Tax=Rhodococcus sp. NPDC059234 TaxID=3346781 RepID=UPI00366E38CB